MEKKKKTPHRGKENNNSNTVVASNTHVCNHYQTNKQTKKKNNVRAVKAMTHGSLSNNNNKTEGVGQINAAVPVLLKTKCDEVYNYKKRKRGGGKKKGSALSRNRGRLLKSFN